MISLKQQIAYDMAAPRVLDLFLEARAEKEFDEKESWND